MKRTLLTLIVLIGLGLAFAQTVKIAYVNTDRILAGSNEAAEIARIYDMERTGWMNQIRTLREDIQTMERSFEIDKLTKNEAAKKAAQDKIDAKKTEAGQKLEEYFGDGGKAEQRYKELIDPLTKKINDVIKEISEDNKYTLVLDISMGTILYALPSMDITDQVLAELNKDTVAPKAEDSGDKDLEPPVIDDGKLKPDDKHENGFVPKK